MKVEVEARHIFVGVRALAYGGERSLGGTLSRLRTELGTRAHERYARERRREEPGLQTEVVLSATFDCNGWTVTLRGRADVVIERPDMLLIEEVKSIVGRVEEIEGEQVSARMQAQLYALCFDEAGCDKALRARVVLVSLQDGGRRVIETHYVRRHVRALLDARLRLLIEDVERRIARHAEKCVLAAKLSFPYAAPRPHQQELMDTMAEGLAQGRPLLVHAPTGIGKTVSALLPALRFALQQDATLFYLTAKTSQREHVARTFTDVVGEAPGKLSAVTLRRREQMCPPGDLRCHPEVCPFLQRYHERAGAVVNGLLAESVHISPEQLFARGEETMLCPYELAADLAGRVDVVIGDFNHVFDGAVADALGHERGRVVVIDEAHNLFDRARGYDSPFIGQQLLRRVREVLEDEPLDDAWRDVLAELEAAMEAAQAAVDADGLVGFEGCVEHTLDSAELARHAERAGLLAMRWARRRWQRAESSRDDPVLDLASTLIHLFELSMRDDRALIGYVASEDGPQGRGIGIVCVDPARRLGAAHRASRGTIAMSATLSPLSYFAEVLGLSSLAPITTSAPSPFPREHREVVVAAHIATTLRERETHMADVASLIARIVAERPGSYIAFFPSYAYLSSVCALLGLPKEQLLVQLQGAPPALRARQLARLRGSGTRLLLAVTGGVFAEGIDLPGDLLIGAIVVGPSLPALSFARLMMRRHYDERHEAGFAYAMVYPGLQRVIQAAGRVIRTERDRGVIALLGRRFAETEYAACLPADWYRYHPRELISDDPVARIGAFWRQTKKVEKSGSEPRPAASKAP